MRIRWISLAGAAIVGSLAATRAARAPRVDIAGCVIDLWSGGPIVGVRITTVPDDGHGVSSDTTGFFTLVLGTEAPRTITAGRIGYGGWTGSVDSAASGKISIANVALAPVASNLAGTPQSVATGASATPAPSGSRSDACQRRLTSFGGRRAPLRGPVYVEGCITELDARIPSAGVIVTMRSDTTMTDRTGYFGLIGTGLPGFDSVLVGMPTRKAVIGVQIPENRRGQVGTIMRDPTPGDTTKPSVGGDGTARCRERLKRG